MLKTALRFLLLRFLPGRLIPLLTVIEVVRMVRRLRRKPAAPRRVVTSQPPVRPLTSRTPPAGSTTDPSAPSIGPDRPS